MSTVELASPPALGPSYRRAALGMLSSRSADNLPQTRLVVRGVPVDLAHLADYSRVCGFRLGATLPPTYPHVLAFPLALRLMSDPAFPFPVVGMVHVANEISVAAPIPTDSTMDIQVHAERLRDHERGRQLDIVAVATVDGTEVWRGVSTYLRRESGSTSLREAGERREPAKAPPASAVWTVPASVGPAYARVSGDRNPIHLSRLAARLFGFRRTIAHGMWTKARCLAALEGRLPQRYTVNVAFKLPILLPATVAFSSAPRWSFAVHDARSGRPHLTGTVRE